MKQYFRLFSCCIPVRGARRATICDIQRSSFDFIPNELVSIVEMAKEMPFESVLAQFEDADDKATIQEYFDFLIEKEYGFWCDSLAEVAQFPDLDLQWDYPAHISNAIIDVNEHSAHNWKEIFDQLEELGCKDLQIRSFCEQDATFFQEITALLEDRRIKSVQVLLKYNPQLSEQDYVQFCRDCYRIAQIVVWNYQEDKVVSAEIDATTEVIFTTQQITDATHCGIILPAYFTINIETFTESQKHNSCLNRKLSIDVKGDICNCPALPQRYGNIQDTTLKSAIEKVAFKDAWFINKDQIDTCKECEFRYICTDCRAFVANPLDKPVKCSYNPQTAKWDEAFVQV